MLASTRAKVDRGRGALAALAPQPRKDGGKRRVAVLLNQQLDRKDHLAATAVQFQSAVRPVGQVVRCSKRRRVHRQTIAREQRENKRGPGAVRATRVRLSRL
jgi:hypothetical protein